MQNTPLYELQRKKDKDKLNDSIDALQQQILIAEINKKLSSEGKMIHVSDCFAKALQHTRHVEYFKKTLKKC